MTWFNFLLDFRFYGPIAIIYFAQVTGSYALGMSIFSIAMLAQAILEVPTGIYSDMIGKRKTVMLGAMASVVSVICYAVGGSYFWLALGAAVEGLARAFYSGNNESLLHDWLMETGQEEEYAEHLGKTSSMFQWAAGVTAIVGGWLAGISFGWVMWLSVIPALAGFWLSTKMTDPQLESKAEGNVYAHLKEAFRLFITNKKLRQLSVAQSIEYAVGEAGYQFRSAFVALWWPLWAIGVVKTLTNVGAGLSFQFAGKLIKKFTALRLLMLGNTYSYTVNVLALLFPSVASPAVMSTTSLFYGVNEVSRGELMQREYNQKQRATMASLNSLFGSVLFAVTALLLGLFADQVGPTAALLVLRVPALISLILIWRLFRRYG